jgi:hypothetical protein
MAATDIVAIAVPVSHEKKIKKIRSLKLSVKKDEKLKASDAVCLWKSR